MFRRLTCKSKNIDCLLFSNLKLMMILKLVKSFLSSMITLQKMKPKRKLNFKEYLLINRRKKLKFPKMIGKIMNKKLENIGFYTLCDTRAKSSSICSPLYRAEIILLDACNFSCPYCRGLREDLRGILDYQECVRIINELSKDKLKNIRFSGGEPTLYKRLNDVVKLCKSNKIERIALSTNGSAELEKYLSLIDDGVNDFSISLDACCVATGDKMCGGKIGMWEKVICNIKEISKLTYVTVGIVVTRDNFEESFETIKLASDLGVSDIRVIPAAQFSKKLSIKQMDELMSITKKYPILKYRIHNILNDNTVRGLSKEDNQRCPLVLDDLAIAASKHFPCIIYMREKGDPIGIVSNIETVRKERQEWFTNHNCFDDKICRGNCLDVCRDYNNRWKLFQEKGVKNVAQTIL